jgi:hypothetical protein
MQRNKNQANISNRDAKNNQTDPRRDRNFFENRNLTSLFKDDFIDPFDDDLFSFGFGSRRRRDELTNFGSGFDSIFNHFRKQIEISSQSK